MDTDTKVQFDTHVQWIKYKVLTELSKHVWNHDMDNIYLSIPKAVIPGPKPSMRCCIYKERAIVQERIKIAMDDISIAKCAVEVIEIACDECSLGGYEVTNDCRGCLAKRCSNVCKKEAIYFDKYQKAHIDKNKCVNCGLCARACSFSAIANRKRPCEVACKVGAIQASPDSLAAVIDEEKCISCGACVYQCPFGAIQDRSSIVRIIHRLQNKEPGRPVIAMIAPSIVGQFQYTSIGKLINGILELGFDKVYEAALGADKVAYREAQEFLQNKPLTSSCCPAFVEYIRKYYPTLSDKISHNLSPMAELGKVLKEKYPLCQIVFIGPCTAKKKEITQESVKPYIDDVLTFEELQALLDSKSIDPNKLEDALIQDATYFGRVFARTGGVTEAIQKAISELDSSNDSFHPIACSGIEECKKVLTKLKLNTLPFNFIEGMACVDGCINGACNINHEVRNSNAVNEFAKKGKKNELANQ